MQLNFKADCRISIGMQQLQKGEYRRQIIAAYEISAQQAKQQFIFLTQEKSRYA